MSGHPTRRTQALEVTSVWASHPAHACRILQREAETGDASHEEDDHRGARPHAGATLLARAGCRAATEQEGGYKRCGKGQEHHRLQAVGRRSCTFKKPAYGPPRSGPQDLGRELSAHGTAHSDRHYVQVKYRIPAPDVPGKFDGASRDLHAPCAASSEACRTVTAGPSAPHSGRIPCRGRGNGRAPPPDSPAWRGSPCANWTPVTLTSRAPSCRRCPGGHRSTSATPSSSLPLPRFLDRPSPGCRAPPRSS